jgi:hypothetical protein
MVTTIRKRRAVGLGAIRTRARRSAPFSAPTCLVVTYRWLSGVAASAPLAAEWWGRVGRLRLAVVRGDCRGGEIFIFAQDVFGIGDAKLLADGQLESPDGV